MRKHGGKVVFFGRFLAVSRAWAAFLAGTNRMLWVPFLLYNALRSIIRATLYAIGAAWWRPSMHFLVHLMRPGLDEPQQEVERILFDLTLLHLDLGGITVHVLVVSSTSTEIFPVNSALILWRIKS